MYKIAICDDDEITLDNVCTMMSETADECNIDISIIRYSDGQKLAEDVENRLVNVNLVIFDVLIGKQNGIDLACTLKRSTPEIKFIFMTSFGEYALNGYEAEASGFLIKPVDKEKLKAAFLRAYKSFERKNLIIKDNDKTVSVNLNNICYIEVFGKCLSIHLKNGSVFKTTKSLSDFLTLLPANDFVQCHRSFVVAVGAVESIKRYELTMQDGCAIPISKLRYADIQKALIENYSSR